MTARPLPAPDPLAEARAAHRDAAAAMLAARTALRQAPAARVDDPLSVARHDALVARCDAAEQWYGVTLRQVRRLHAQAQAPAYRPVEAVPAEEDEPADDDDLRIARGVVAALAATACAVAFPVAFLGWPLHALAARVVAGVVVAAGGAWCVVAGRMWEVGGR